ncbi:hypothetical protein C8F01DRAFT_581323 [Mycena amicta]|nr:hypothetical protein C8F01DRAFT_581323 [Mycena amicta]
MPSPRSSPRLHRFPHRVDYTLLPAPLDLSLPFKVEKDSSVPAIIVTPSSPSSARDFSIAFYPKPTLRERLRSFAPQYKARTLLFLSLIFLLCFMHVVTHRLAARRPHLEFSVQSGEVAYVEHSFGSWVIRSLWGEDDEAVAREFVVDDVPAS